MGRAVLQRLVRFPIGPSPFSNAVASLAAPEERSELGKQTFMEQLNQGPVEATPSSAPVMLDPRHSERSILLNFNRLLKKVSALMHEAVQMRNSSLPNATLRQLRETNEECASVSNWALRKLPEMRSFSSTSSDISWKRLAMALDSLLPRRYATKLLSSHGALFGSAPQELSSMLQGRLCSSLSASSSMLQGRMCSSLSASRAQIHDEEDQLADCVGDSDARSDSELEEFEWEDDEDAEEPEDFENLEDLGNLEDFEDIEEPTSPRAPSKLNGRQPDYSMRIEAPVDEVYALLHSRGFITVKQKRPTPNDSVLGQEDYDIVTWYRRVCIGLLNYYSCCDNFLKVKAIVNYQLRWSAIHTLSKKHKSSSRQVIQKYGKNLVVRRDGKVVASFLSVEEIKKHQKGFLEIDPVPPETLIDTLYTRMKRRRREEEKSK